MKFKDLTTRYTKQQRDGWQGRTEIGMSEGRVLVITTRKTPGGLRSHASIQRLEGGFLVTMLFGDFAKTILATQARCTEKEVQQCHAQALALLPKVMGEIKAYYAPKDLVIEPLLELEPVLEPVGEGAACIA